MNEVVRLINIVLIMLLLVSIVGSSKLKTKAKYPISGQNTQRIRFVKNIPNNHASNFISNNPPHYHHVFSVKTQYTNNYNKYSPLINGRIPQFIHAPNGSLIKNVSLNKKNISQMNSRKYNLPFNRPIPSEPYIHSKNYNIIPLGINDIKNNPKSSLNNQRQIPNENFSLPVTNNNTSRIPKTNPNRESIFPLQLPSDLMKKILLRQKLLLLQKYSPRNQNGVFNNRLLSNSQINTNVQNVYNPMPVMTHYNMPVLHHIPVNQLVRRYIPVYYPVPIEHRINVPIQIPIKVPQRVLIPQAVPFGVKIPVPIPVKVEIPQYKEFQVQKPVYVKVPIYEHIPVYHHFAMTENKGNLQEEECEDDNTTISNSNKKELNKKLKSFLQNIKGN